MKLSETAAIITGGASGLGGATARYFRSQGADVTILDRDTENGQKLADEIGAGFSEADVTDEQSAKAAINTATEKMGKLTTVVNCAGIVIGEKIYGHNGPHDLKHFRRVIDINLTGSFNIARLAIEKMSKNNLSSDGTRGVIINTASIAAFEGQKGQAAYAASKAGIAGLTLPMARDLSRLGIRVMTIAPGIFRTPMMAGLPQEVQDNLAATVPFPTRLGDPSEFGRLAGFIVECSYLNGEIIRLDGALRMQ